ncbi:pirin family protein [Coleofasciculus sp. FACHB-64]|uniref:pirin family protein n=1 Tax=Cyanophyceae TaxID=3028117 RepID=UPI0016839B9B|nr:MULTISPECIES: pirin family protein [unclassified Coleofasciculus]MBD1838321.1 pirin family protein [Coleofasciculus sp. FACHB-501]MBD2045020.1 pirin family protein [Coleofasciculus sp. FACHB-64]
MTTQIRTMRTVAGIINSVETLEGEGMLVRRPFPKSTFSHFDPFLLLDELGPVDIAPGQAKGAPDHPHRGFETVSYVLEGRLEHKDSQGHAGQLGSGDVQWMTAGAGVVHSEMPEREFARTGGRLHGLQLWVNLPRRDKMMKPRYQEISAEQIPTAQTDDGLVRVKAIAGEALGVKSAIATQTPIMYLHFTLQPGGTVVQPVPKEYNAFTYVLDGEGLFGADKERAGDGQMVLFAQDGEEVAISNPSDARSPLDVLLIAGVPLNEPVVRYGPFVMNTQAEIVQAIEDYRNGRMGSIDF